MNKDPDFDLVQKSQSGDKVSFGKLVDHYYEMVYAISYGVVNHREIARDVVQEVFLKVFREIENFRGQSKFKTWLYRISMNAAIDQVRKKRPVDSLDATDVSDDENEKPVIITDASPGPRDNASQNELRAILDKGIAELSPDHRAVLVLREWQGLSYDEIAEALGVEIGTVMSRLFYARRKLGEILGVPLKEIRGGSLK